MLDLGPLEFRRTTNPAPMSARRLAVVSAITVTAFFTVLLAIAASGI